MIGVVLGDDLLAGPRGRRLCWELLSAPAIAPSALAGQLPAAARAVAAALRRDGGALLFDALRGSVDAAMYWQPPDACDVELSAPALADTLRPVAEVVAAMAETAWWDSELPEDEQHHVERLHDDRVAGSPALRGVASVLLDWRAEQDRQNAQMRDIRTGADPSVPASVWYTASGIWWSMPGANQVPTTTRSLPGRGPVGLWLVEDNQGWARAVSWPVRATRAPRVYEVTGPQAWSDLVGRHPLDVSEGRAPDWYRATGRAGRWLEPDWASVAAEFDAVHVSVLGYLTTAGRAVAVGTDPATVLAGSAPDETYWLTDILDVAGTPTSWVSDDQGGEWRVSGESLIR